MTRRRWIADDWDRSTASLSGEQAEHLIRVLRARRGMEFDVVAGGGAWRAAISSLEDGVVRFTLLAPLETPPALPVALLVSIFKFDRMEWMVEKATELGVGRIVPMAARRSEKRLVQAAPARVERWRRIALEAAKQSRRADLPIVEDPQPLADAIARKRDAGALRLVLSEAESETTLPGAAQAAQGANATPVEVATGPEGGWTPEEERLFLSENWTPVSLGPRILRAETAGIASLAVLSVLLQQ
jgi:16S rRNA (uracil1498-N3)-methyltransferase